MDLIWHLIALSGGLPLVMGLLLLIAIAVIVDRLWFFYRVLGAGKRIEHDLLDVTYRDLRGIDELGKRYAHTLQGRLLLLVTRSKADEPEALSQHLDEEVPWSLPRLDQYLWLLDTTATLGPLLGLFGTIIGMIQTFNVLGGSGAAVQATGGIADALISTALGLFIAIVSVVFLNLLNKRLRLAMHQLDLIRVMLLNRVFGSGTAARADDRHHHATSRNELLQPLESGNAPQAEGA